jgi:hypothetical protein
VWFNVTSFSELCLDLITDKVILKYISIELLKRNSIDSEKIEMRDLISRLLKLNPRERFGDGKYDSGAESIRDLPFFVFLDWHEISEQAMPP